eukprot:547371-Pelagomonas_calceolata.AAC.1
MSGCPFLMEQQPKQQQGQELQRQHSIQTHESGEGHPSTISTTASASSLDSADVVRIPAPVQPSWLIKRPNADGQEHLRRRELRKLNRGKDDRQLQLNGCCRGLQYCSADPRLVISGTHVARPAGEPAGRYLNH